MERDEGRSPGAGINPEIEEGGEEHLRRMLATDQEFRRAWEAGRARRELGMLILEKRIELGLSQRELAKKVGTSQNRIYLIENGETSPRLDTLQRLADVLGFALEIRPGELVAG